MNKFFTILLILPLFFVGCSKSGGDDGDNGKETPFYYGTALGQIAYPDKGPFNFEARFNRDMGYVFNMGVYYSDINGESEKEKYIIYIKGTYTYVDNKDGSFKVILSNTANLEYGVRYLDGSSIIAPKETAELYALFPTEYTLSDGGIRSTPNGTGITIN